MEHIKRHVFVCINQRQPGHPKGCCQSKGSIDILQGLGEAVSTSDLAADTAVSGSTCLGPCTLGPSVVVYPEGVWYQGVKAEDISEIVEEHLKGGRPVERLRLRLPDAGGEE
jgi:(2Fe-2S) ferredoxin